MAATNYTVNGNDLNTIFAPIAVGQTDYGQLVSDSGLIAIQSTWVRFNSITSNKTNNISISSNRNRFTINTSGLYRLNISLNFGLCNRQYQNILFVLSSNNSDLSGNDTYEFIPSPTMAQIYAINCSGANNWNNGDTLNNLNDQNIGNCLGLNMVNNGVEQSPYFFAFRLSKSPSELTIANSNFFTLDITFEAVAGQVIHPFIRCRRNDDGNASATLEPTSKWMFTKISDI